MAVTVNSTARTTGELVRLCREDEKLTQSQLAERLGKSLRQVQRLESGNRIPYEVAIRLEAVLPLFKAEDATRLVLERLRGGAE